MQRFFDIVLSLVSIIALFPIFLPIILILKFSGEGEVFYFQKRVCRGGGEFYLLKFATMLKNSPNIGTGEITIKDDPRVLPFGKVLRKTKVNELPQLWNILTGELSVVGPRPMVPNTFSRYPEIAQEKLNKVRPGLTGIGSIIFRDEEKYLRNSENPVEFYEQNIIPYKSNLEIWFVENQNIALYFNIIIVTAWVLIFPGSKIVDIVFKGIPPKPRIFQD